MNYHTETKICPSELGFLRSMIGEEVEKVTIRGGDDGPFSEGLWCLGVDLTTNVKRVKIVNDVVCGDDGDEYFQLRANDEEWGKWTSTWESLDLDLSGPITGVTVWRDRVSWSNEEHHWEAEADVAILLHFKDGQILFKAIDSLAGFIAVYMDQEAIRHEFEDAESTWLYFKADKVERCHRSCIHLK